MKKTFLILILAVLSISSFAQKYDDLSADELKAKARSARTMGTIFVASGPVIAVGGIGTLIYGLLGNEDPSFFEGDTYYYNSNGVYTRNTTTKNYTSSIVLGAVGTAVGIAVAVYSTHFFSKARMFKKLARAKVKATTDNINMFKVGNNYAYTPARQMKFTLTIPLGK